MATTLGLLSATMLWASRVPIVGLVGGGASFWRRGRILTYTTETVARELLLRNEYPAAENRILKAQLQVIQHAQKNRYAMFGVTPIRMSDYTVKPLATTGRVTLPVM